MKNSSIKDYTFTVKAPKVKISTSIIAGIVDELKDEARQLALTTEINVKTTKAHLNILKSLIKELNGELKIVNLSFDEIRIHGTTNGYTRNVGVMNLPKINKSIAIKINGISGDFEESKYLTFTGKYDIQYGIYTTGEFYNISFKNTNDVNSFLRDIEYNIKREINLVSWN